MHESPFSHPALTRGFATAVAPAAAGLRPLGVAGLDRALGGGLAAGRLHEIFALDEEDASAAGGFAAMLALRLAKGSAPLLWLREERAQRLGQLYGPGLIDLGLDVTRLVIGVLPDPLAVLRAAVDALRCPAPGAVILEFRREPAVLDLTASRRIALAARASGVTALLLRVGGRPRPSAAETRWSVEALPSDPLEAAAPGHPAMRLALLRRRGGPADLAWHLEWDRDAECFRDTPLCGAAVPVPVGGSLAGGAALRHAG